MRRHVAWSLAVALLVAACAESGSPQASPQASAVAEAAPPPSAAEAGASSAYREPVWIATLGDGYTVGAETDAPGRDSWPEQVAAAMRRDGMRVVVKNFAERSHTSDTVLEEQVGEVGGYEPDVVTLQVGGSDILSGDTSMYQRNVEEILDRLLLILPAERIFAITTPDHTLTTKGQRFGSVATSRQAVHAVNATLAEVATARGITVIDIGPVNDLAASDASLVNGEGLYGTAKQYAGWAEIIGRPIRAALIGPQP